MGFALKAFAPDGTSVAGAAIALGVSFVMSSTRATKTAHRLDEAHAARRMALAAPLTAMQAQVGTIACVTRRRRFYRVGGALKQGCAAVVAGTIGYTIGSIR